MEINAAKSFASNYAGASMARSQAPKDQTAASELPAPKAVSQSADAQRARNEVREPDYRQVVSQEPLIEAQERAPSETPPDSKFVRTYDKDSESGEFVYKSMNSNTGEVVVQFPSEITLKLRSYVRETPGGAEGYTSDNQDIKVDTKV